MKHSALFILSSLLLSGLSSPCVMAEPEIFGASGDVIHRGELRIMGAGFGTKSPPEPLFWAPMDESLDPSSLGRISSWASVNNMEFASREGPGGGGALKAINDSGKWTGRVDTPGFYWSDPGQKMYLFRKVKHNFSIFTPVEINWKSWRLWGTVDGSGIATSVMDGVWNGSFAMDHSVESKQNNYPFTDKAAAFGQVGVWNTNEILMQSNTNPDGYGNGFWQYITNGRVAGQIPYQAYDGTRHLKLWDATTNPKLNSNYVVHGVQANHTMGQYDRYWASDVYLDTTWSRVIIGNAPTLSDSTSLEIQPPTEWSANSITVVLNIRGFPPWETPYLFVVDADNNASEGFALSGKLPTSPENVGVD